MWISNGWSWINSFDADPGCWIRIGWHGCWSNQRTRRETDVRIKQWHDFRWLVLNNVFFSSSNTKREGSTINMSPGKPALWLYRNVRLPFMNGALLPLTQLQNLQAACLSFFFFKGRGGLGSVFPFQLNAGRICKGVWHSRRSLLLCVVFK